MPASTRTPRLLVETSLSPPCVWTMNEKVFCGEIKVAPYLLESCGHLRMHLDLAHRVLQDIRARDYSMTVKGEKLNVWATPQKPRGVRERSKTLIRLARILQADLKAQDHVHEDYKVVCWRSTSVVISGKNVYKLNDTVVNIEPNWYDANSWAASKESIEERLQADEQQIQHQTRQSSATSFSCWTHDAQRKSLETLDAFLDAWDSAFFFQMRYCSKHLFVLEPRVHFLRQGISRGDRVVCVSASAVGRYSKAVVANHRWPSHMTRHVDFGRVLFMEPAFAQGPSRRHCDAGQRLNMLRSHCLVAAS